VSTKQPQDDFWDKALRTPTQVRDDNLRNRAKAAPTPAPFLKPGAACGLCGGDGLALIRMQRFDKQGTVLACAGCLRDLMGKSELDV
jgi:hypothetical protein